MTYTPLLAKYVIATREQALIFGALWIFVGCVTFIAHVRAIIDAPMLPIPLRQALRFLSDDDHVKRNMAVAALAVGFGVAVMFVPLK